MAVVQILAWLRQKAGQPQHFDCPQTLYSSAMRDGLSIDEESLRQAFRLDYGLRMAHRQLQHPPEFDRTS